MSIFQQTVIAKHIKGIDKEAMQKAFTVFKNFFGDALRQENIRNSKEEQFQEGFLHELFCNVLGYTLNPNPNYNLITENKNIKDSKKADGAIIINNKVKAVIELKGTDTTDLGKIETQAFGYKNNQPECVYVITSNFEKLRFYIDNAIEHLEFNLFTLSYTDFELLYVCLGYENLSQNVAKKIKEESVSEEDVITKKLYKDYSLFKRELYQNLVALNPQFEALELFKKSQKLLDRFLFLFFGEDRHLLPPNSVRLIVTQWNQLKELDEYTPLYERFKKYFGYLNTGYKGKQHDVFAYNGGLFKPDEILDAIKIDDELLFKHTLKLSEYDFASEVDVNILGHIFENSLNELDEMKSTLEHAPVSKQVSKRKKDGVFYTPKYITKYIVDNTVGKLCTEKKTALAIVEEDYFTDKKRQKKTILALADKLETYRAWLMQLTICDPACGSGAFLNQALDFLISEHRYIDELKAKLFGDAMVLSDIENSILENNLFGVDLNEESVEIAKLSLWLRTAQPNRKLNDLSNNIKCGNSLIDDVAVAGEKAFNWQKEFPQVFGEKQKRAFHITTALHDSRTSQRMIDYKVREKRFMGTKPYPEYTLLTDDEEILLTKIVAEIVESDGLNVMAFNVCKDHIHLLLVCEEGEVSKIMQKIKSKTAREINIHRGVTVVSDTATMEHDGTVTMEHDSAETMEHDSTATMGHDSAVTMEHAPLPLSGKRKETQNSLWTQKFGCTVIEDEKHLWNTIEYIKNNRTKHGLEPLDWSKINNEYIRKGSAIQQGRKNAIQQGRNNAIQQGSMLPCLYQNYEHVFNAETTGGFDVIIGNPPYVVLTPNDFKNYKYTAGNNNTYIAFLELSLRITNVNSEVGFIIPNTWFSGDNFKAIREFVLGDNNLRELIQLPYDIFQAYVDTSIVLLNSKVNSRFTSIYKYDIRNHTQNIEFKNLELFENYNWIKYGKIFLNSDLLKIGEMVWFSAKCVELGRISKINRGSLPPKENEKSKTKDEYYNIKWFDNQIYRYDEDINATVFVNYDALRENKNIEVYKGKRIFGRQLMSRQFRMNLSLIEYDCAFKKNLYVIYELNTQFAYEYVLSILNSKLFSFAQVNFNTSLQRDDFPAFSLNDFKKFQIPQLEITAQKPFIEKAEQMILLNKQLQEVSQKFQRTIQRKFELEDLPKKLQDWYMLSYADFIKELAKKKFKLTLSQEAEWEEYFNEEKVKALAIKTEIDATDKAIDKMVYYLYELTDEEIKIVEGA